MVDLVAEYSKRAEQIKRVQKLVALEPLPSAPRETQPVSMPYKLAMRLTEDQLDELARDYEAGAIGGELAAKYGLARSTVIQALRGRGVTIRRARVSPEETAQIVEFYRNGMRQVDIARQMGRDKGLIWHLLKRAGLL